MKRLNQSHRSKLSHDELFASSGGEVLRRKKQPFDPASYESYWQKIWEEKGVYQPDLVNAKRPFYNLMMFPYPSAEGLHVGNMYAFTGADIYGRFKRMQGYDVFEPIGLDGFGIHSENYAIKIGKHPAEQAKISEKNFYRQLRAIGNGFAWRNTLETYDPEYYRWTQWIFVVMFKNGLAYRKKSPLNFCPSCKTVLADEQVIDESCERCKSRVEKREMEQWFFRITKYAERLLQNTYKESFKWSQKVKIGQRNWIGKKEGINITYPVVEVDTEKVRPSKNEQQGQTFQEYITCFTTRPDTNFGATFVVVAPEHPFVAKLLNSLKLPKSLQEEISDYLAKSKAKSEAERIAEGRKKTGVFTGFYCLNPLNNYKMPVFISDFVLGSFGTGAVVGVPGHDLRDFEFAKEFGLPIKRVVVGKDGDTSDITRPEQVLEEEGILFNSGFLNGKDVCEAIRLMMDYLEQKGWGKRVTTYKLRDWCISRQRYWGAPIPMIFCPKCAERGVGWLSLYGDLSPKSFKSGNDDDQMAGWYPVEEKDLPVLLPPLSDWKPEGTGKGPLAKVKEFVEVVCLHCGGQAQRETDVCDTFLDSSWYFLRYPSVSDSYSPKSLKSLKEKAFISTDLPWDRQITRRWLPVNQYTGGAEHTVLHLLYARFVTMALADMGYLDFEEPFSHFFAHGLIIAEGAKMSKSRGNIIVPDEYIRKYGADTLRTYLMFLGPFDQGGDFRDTGIAGMFRFLGRIWRLVIANLSPNPKLPKSLKSLKERNQLNRVLHRTIKEVTEDLENFRYNTAIAHIMEYVNELTDNRQFITDSHIKSLLLLLAPFAPHMTEELWQKVSRRWSKINGQKNKKRTDNRQLTTDYRSIHLHPWPAYDPKFLEEEEVTIVVQINGKVRETIQVQTQNSKVKSEVEKIATRSEKIKKYLAGKKIKRIIFIPGKLINFVV